MIVSRKQGALGNQLFFIGAMLGVAHRQGVNCYMPSWEYADMFPNLREFVSDTTPLGFSPREYIEPHFHYAKIPYYPEGVIIDGYFQSEKYFEGADIKTALVMNGFAESRLKDYTSIHIRRGDYLRSNGFHPVVTTDYIEEAQRRIGGKFVVFSDDVEWCRQNVKGEIIHSESDIMDMYLMTQCKNNIIANSSFSWWGAYLNGNPDKRVIAPSNWFGDKTMITKDLYCEGWEII